MNEKIDILMATYNGEKYLADQIESILNQTYNNFNLIISDDNSSDGTIEILNRYQKKDSRIIIYRQKKNLGYIKNFEYLCSKSKSKYFALSDQDDVWEKTKIEDMINYLNVKQAVLVYCDLTVVDENLEIINYSMIRKMNKLKWCLNKNNYELLKYDNVVTGCAMIGLTKIMQKAIPFPEKTYVHDWWIATVCSQSGPIFYLDKALVKYRQHSKNLIGIKSQTKQEYNFEEYKKEIIDFKINQFRICVDNAEKFLPYVQKSNYKNLKMFKKLEAREKVTIFEIFSFYKKSGIISALKKICIFKTSKLAKRIYKIRRK